MGRNSKWIESRPGDSVRQIAQRALESRLERVWHFLDAEAEAPRSGSENVHQLRVFSRRATAAMDVFAAYLPPKRAKRLRKKIKKVRQAAGGARDLDVLVDRWTRGPGGMAQDLIGALVREIERHRQQAQDPIRAIHKKLSAGRFSRKAKKLIDRVRKRGGEARDEPFDCFARGTLCGLVVLLLQAGEAELRDPEALHAFRIQGKQVRYAMEIFAGAFDDDFRRQLYPLVVQLQDRLGAINDHATAEARFLDWLARAKSCETTNALTAAIQVEQRALETSRQEFFDWWTPERRSALRERFARYVERDVPALPAPDANPPGAAQSSSQ